MEPTTLHWPVDGEQLGVDHGGLVLVDVGAGTEQVAAAVTTEPADDWMIDLRSCGENLDSDPRARGLPG